MSEKFSRQEVFKVPLNPRGKGRSCTSMKKVETPSENEEPRTREIPQEEFTRLTGDMFLNVIKDVMNGWERITHILNWKVSNEGPKKVGNHIRRIVYRSIHSVRHFFPSPDGDAIGITWKMPGVRSSAYYYTASIYSDVVTAEHTKTLLRHLVNHVKTHPDTQYLRDMEGYADSWGIAYLVTRPLEYLGAPVAAGEIL